jgi:hypothetical protein
MPRSLLLPLIAAFALAACSKQADTGAAPAPETAEAPDDMAAPADTTAVMDDTMAPADEVAPAEEPAYEEAAPAEEPAYEEAAPAEEAVDSAVPSDATEWPSDSADEQADEQ